MPAAKQETPKSPDSFPGPWVLLEVRLSKFTPVPYLSSFFSYPRAPGSAPPPQQILESAFSLSCKHGVASRNLFFYFYFILFFPFSKPTTTLGGQGHYYAVADTPGADYLPPAAPRTPALPFPPIQILNTTSPRKIN